MTNATRLKAHDDLHLPGESEGKILQEEGCKNPVYNETSPAGLMNVLITTRNFNIAPKNDASENVSPDSNMASFWVSMCQISGWGGGGWGVNG